MKHNKVKNPKWQEANQLAMYNHGQKVELGYHRETNPGRGQGGTWKRGLLRSDHLITLPNWGDRTLAFAIWISGIILTTKK